MTDRELTGKVHSAVYHQCQRRGYAAPVDVLMEIGVLLKEKYEDWRRGRIDYLERVCTVNLRKLSFIMREIRAYAQKSGLKPSVTVYKQWAVKKKSGQGHKPVIRRASARAAILTLSGGIPPTSSMRRKSQS